jgi:radical SAM superfamily enzyme YgiQ (UPF0313 family)
MREGMQKYGFRSYKFRDPLFGLDRRRVFKLAELIGRLPRKVQFSIEGRIDLLQPDVLRALKLAGLTSITVGIETPSEETLRNYKRAPIKDDRQREFVMLCRSLGIRTVAGFMIGFPEDTRQSIISVLRYAQQVGPTFANFNIVTPYPGTEFFEQVKHEIADFDFSKYDVYTPVMKCRHLTREQVAELHARCFVGYYFRSRYFQQNAHLLWPLLRRLGFGPKPAEAIAPRQIAPSHKAHAGLTPRPLTQLASLRRDPPHAPSAASREARQKQSA